MISLLLFLARLCGKLVGIFARAQTRLLSRAQFLGWMPSEEENKRLLLRQTQLFNWNMIKENRRRMKGLVK